MNIISNKRNSVKTTIIALLTGFILLGASYASDFPEVVTKLSITVEQGSLRIVPLDHSKAKVTGRVQEVRWSGHDLKRTSYWKKVPVYTSSGYTYDSHGNRQRRIAYYKSELREKVEPYPTRWGSYIPSKISMGIPYLSTKSKPDVLSDGQFSGYLELEEGYYFSKVPNVNMDPGYSWWKTEREIVFLPENPKKPGSFGNDDEGYKHKITLYFIDVNDALAEGLMTKIRIEFAEKNSRVPVKPDVKITMEDGPTFGLIKAEWEKKYDTVVVKKLEETYWESKSGVGKVLEKGDVEEVKGQEAVEFWAFIGSSFKLESRDRNFYYFQGVFKADKVPLTKKTVLLIEIGGKLRPDDEGHGGQIISD